MKRFLVLAFGVMFSLAGSHNALAGGPSLEHYHYYRNIQMPPQSEETTAVVYPDFDFLQSVRDDFSDVQIVNQLNDEVRYDLAIREGGYLKQVRVIGTSSNKDGASAGVLYDDDALTTYTFDESIDREEPSWALFDLGRLVPLRQITLYVPDNASVWTFQVKAGTTRDNLRTVIGERSLQVHTTFTVPPLARYVWIGFTGRNLKVDDVLFFAHEQAQISFPVQPEESYRIFYSSPELTSIRFRKKTGTFVEGGYEAILSREKENDQFPKDFDQDGVQNEEDNCPYEANARQEDTDEDRIGDVCDNAPKLKNTNQYDSDRDGVGDVGDNCPFEKNSGQADRDRDGIGDICDEIDRVESDEEYLENSKGFSFPPMTPLNATVLGLAVLAIFLIGMLVTRRK